MKQFRQAFVDFRCQQRLPGFEEFAKVLDLPQFGIHRDPLRRECTRVRFFDLREVLLRQTREDVEIRVLRKETKVGQRVYFGLLVFPLVKLRLGEDVMHFQPAHPSEQVGFERQPGAPITGLSHAGEEVEHRVETSAEAPAGEMPRLYSKPAMPEAQLVKQLVQSAIWAFQRR